MSQTTPRRGLLSKLGLLAARNRGNPLVRSLAGLCRRYLDFYDNLNYDMETNGERFVLHALSQFEPRVIFDAGANIGDWSLTAKSNCPTATIHAFEITKPTWETLAARTSHEPDILCRPVGLSDAPGTVQVRYYEAMPFLTTTVDYPHAEEFTLLDAEVMTGDAYAEQNDIRHIDFLKIDVEGMEKQVLSGFETMFSRSAIDLVQFEYGRVNILNGFLLRNACAFFEKHGYRVGKIYPDHVDFRDYDLGDEDFTGPNYLACHKSKNDILQILAGSRGRS